MPAISYVISLGQTLEQVSVGVAAPTSGSIELRIDQTAAAITDASAAGGHRAVKRSKVQQMMRTLEEYLIKDTNIS